MKGLTLVIIIWLIFFACLIIPFAFWIMKVVRLSKNEDKTGMWVTLVCGIFLTPLVGLIIGNLAFKEVEEKEEDKYFWCGICRIKYEKKFLGGETAHEEKICNSCLGKRQRGESSTYSKSQKSLTNLTRCAGCGKIQQDGEEFWLATNEDKEVDLFCESCKNKMK